MAYLEHRVTKSGEVWRVRFRHAGKQETVTFTDPDRAERWRALATADPDAALRLLDTETTTTSPTMAEWLRTHVDMLTGVTGGSRREYLSYVEHDVEPHPIGLVPVGKLTRADVAGWVQWLEKSRGLAGKTIANRHGFVSAAVASAVDAGHATTNPCRGMRLPRTSHTQEEHVYLTQDEFARLHELIPEHYRPLVMLLVGTGMRFGEATALQVGDVDVATRSIRVRRAWKRTGKAQPELGPTKTRRSDRTVVAPPQVLEVLAPLLAGRHPSAPLLQNRRGGQIKQAAAWKVWRVAVAEFAGDETRMVEDSRGRPVMEVVSEGPGKHPRIHDLRHTFASWAIQAGVPLPVIQRQLGHESITTTVDTYGHLARSDFDALGTATAAMLPAIRA